MENTISNASHKSHPSSSSSLPSDSKSVFVKDEPEELEAERAFDDIDLDPVFVSLNHPAENVRSRLARQINNSVPNAQTGASKIGGHVWDLRSDSIVVVGLETYYHLNHVADLYGLIDAVSFLTNVFEFVEKPIPWIEVWLRLPVLKKWFERFEEFIQLLGINFDEDTCEITVTIEYEKYMNKEHFEHGFFRKFGLPDYKSYKSLFATTNISKLLEEVKRTWYETYGDGPRPDPKFSLI